MDNNLENQHIKTLNSNLEGLNISNGIPKKRGRKPLNKKNIIEDVQQNEQQISIKQNNDVNEQPTNEVPLNDEEPNDEDSVQSSNSDENIQEEKIPKKRGRKPKIKLEEEVEKIPKKRGRKPKEKIYSIKELPKTFFEENKNETLILHLPINLNNLNNNYPLPKTEDNYSYIDNNHNNHNINNNNNSINNINNHNIHNIHNNNNNSNSNNNNLLTQNNLLDNNKIDNVLFNNDMNLKNIQDTLTNKNNEIINMNNFKTNNAEINNAWDNDYKNNNKIVKKNLRNILYEFINANNDKVWPEKTNIHCWWCCHQFDNTPCSLPQYYKKDKFYVKGIFCSFNCAASYNFNNNDDDMFEKYSLLNLMYKKLYIRNFIKINLAPPRETLKMFGGYLSIEEFRENSLENNKLFNVICPPLISIIPKIEETINHNKFSGHALLGNVNESILNKTHNSLKLKRNKPVTNPNNTLQSFMDLKININN